MGVGMAQSFIIVEPDPIVCMDMQGILLTRYPQSDIIVGASLSDLGPAIHICGAETTLFIKSTLFADDDELQHATRTAAARGGQVVMIGHTGGVDFAAVFVELPFTTEMVLAALDRNAPDSTLDPVG